MTCLVLPVSPWDAAAGGYVTLGVNGLVRGSGSGGPAWDVLLSTFPRNRPGNQSDDAAEAAWQAATVDAGSNYAADGSRPTGASASFDDADREAGAYTRPLFSST